MRLLTQQHAFAFVCLLKVAKNESTNDSEEAKENEKKTQVKQVESWFRFEVSVQFTFVCFLLNVESREDLRDDAGSQAVQVFHTGMLCFKFIAIVK